MVRYLGGKLINIVFSLLILATATFFLMKAVPGDPFTQEKAIPPEIKANIMAHYGLDKPIGEQYLIYMKKLVQFDLGLSMKSQDRTVTSIISQSFGTSAKIGAFAIVISVIIGVYLGMMAALRHRKLVDNSAMFLAVIGISVPNFVIGSMIQYFLSVKLQIFHVAGLESPIDYVLPTIALSTLPIAFIARLTRSTMLEVLTSDYIRTAKAKGSDAARDFVAARPAKRHFAGCHVFGTDDGEYHYRFRCRGANFRSSGPWRVFRGQRHEPGLHAYHGDYHFLCRDFDGSAFPYGYPVHFRGSAYQIERRCS